MAYTRPNGTDRFRVISANRDGLPSFEVDNELNLLVNYLNGVGVIIVPIDEWQVDTQTPVFVDALSFTLPGDQTSVYHTGRKLKADLTGPLVYSTITGSSFAASQTTITIDDAVLDANLLLVYHGLISADSTSSLPTNIIMDDAVNYMHKDGSVTLDNNTPMRAENAAATDSFDYVHIGTDDNLNFGDVTTALRLNSSIVPSWFNGSVNVPLIMAGEGRMWFTPTAPVGWLLCNGAAVSRTTYAALFAVIGVIWGIGDGTTTFNLPDFRGRSPIGYGSGDAGYATFWTLAEKGGAEQMVLTEAQIAAHAHLYNFRATEFNEDTTGGELRVNPNSTSTQYTQNTGGNNSHTNLHPVLSIQFIIKT